MVSGLEVLKGKRWCAHFQGQRNGCLAAYTASDKQVHKNTSVLSQHRGSSGMPEEPFLGESQGMEI